ncbi:MAG: hypothetical protein EA349_09655 [Halomonadaceae bacterium]|nr:MAG: hypothetical protein EA349_09655 [Halomonadaceae bacterium]
MGQQSRQPAESDPAEPRVHPAGRLPGSEPRAISQNRAGVSSEEDLTREHLAGLPGESHGVAEEEAPESVADPAAQSQAENLLRFSQQHQRRKLLYNCDRLLLLDFNSLSLPGWPDHYSIGVARRQRDIWLFSLSLLAVLVLLGLATLVPALVGGVAFGLLVLTGMLGVPPVRQVFTSKPSYSELLLRRHLLLKRARKHIQHLEGKLGLASCCRELGEYNPSLNRSRFLKLYELSQQGRLVGAIRSRGHCQLYLMFALEAEKGYNRLQEAYLQDHQAQIDAGNAAPLDARSEQSDPANGIPEAAQENPPPHDNEEPAGSVDGASVTDPLSPGDSAP